MGTISIYAVVLIATISIYADCKALAMSLLPRQTEAKCGRSAHGWGSLSLHIPACIWAKDAAACRTMLGCMRSSALQDRRRRAPCQSDDTSGRIRPTRLNQPRTTAIPTQLPFPLSLNSQHFRQSVGPESEFTFRQHRSRNSCTTYIAHVHIARENKRPAYSLQKPGRRAVKEPPHALIPQGSASAVDLRSRSRSRCHRGPAAVPPTVSIAVPS